MKTFATFRTTLPDDIVYGADGIPDVPGGKNICELLVSALQASGCEIIDGPYQHEFYGWAFDIRSGGVTIWCMIQYPGPWLLITRQHRRLRDRLLRRAFDTEHDAVNCALTSVISQNPVFSELRWYTREEYFAHAASAAPPN